MNKVNGKPARAAKTNQLGNEIGLYRGAKSTLCAGCGHNAISERITQAFFEMNIDPYNVLKLSGIGCSSKSPAYFLSASHGFNAVHGRMPSIATGSLLANRGMLGIGVSGDGDTGSIGAGQFIHLMRRNLPFIYIVENNGVYGLTKGQFSATADVDSLLKTGQKNMYTPIDLCTLAIELGASFVARSFSGDKKQLSDVLRAAIAHNGTALIDVISPCVTFNDHQGSTKSYSYVQEKDEHFGEISFVPYFEDIEIDYEPGTTHNVEMHDGSHVLLSKLPEDYSPAGRCDAMQMLIRSRNKGELLTGIFYLNPKAETMYDMIDLADQPLAQLSQQQLRPGKAALDEVMQELM